MTRRLSDSLNLASAYLPDLLFLAAILAALIWS